MTPEASQINQWIGQLLTLGPEALVVVGLIVIGYFLKVTPVVQNRFIPGTLFVVAVIAYPIFVWTEVEEDVALIRSVFIAMALWLIAWGLHGTLLRRFEERFGLFQDKAESGKQKSEIDPPPPTP